MGIGVAHNGKMFGYTGYPILQNGSSLWQNGLFILPKWTIHFAKMDYPVLPNFPILPNVFFQNGIAAYLY